jgi:hypothetical protein
VVVAIGAPFAAQAAAAEAGAWYMLAQVASWYVHDLVTASRSATPPTSSAVTFAVPPSSWTATRLPGSCAQTTPRSMGERTTSRLFCARTTPPAMTDRTSLAIISVTVRALSCAADHSSWSA